MTRQVAQALLPVPFLMSSMRAMRVVKAFVHVSDDAVGGRWQVGECHSERSEESRSDCPFHLPRIP